MIAGFAGRLADLAQRFVPDPFVIALGLTALAFGLGWLSMPEPDAGALAAGWFARFAAGDTLTFTAQMAIILVAGSALARAPLVRGGLTRLARAPRGTASAAALTAAVAMLAALVNWGFGLIVGAVLAREIGAAAHAARRRIDYPLVVASGYLGLMVWHGGLSGSAPLKAAEPDAAGAVLAPLASTLFSVQNLLLTALLLVAMPAIAARMAAPARERDWPVAPMEDATPAGAPRESRAARLLGLLVLALGALALWQAFAALGALRGLGFGSVILMLVLAGLLLFGSPQRYARAFGAGAAEAGGILLQFPFYFGILGLLEASGLVERLAGGTASASLAAASLGLPLAFCFETVTFVSAAIVNLFVPSGGGQWAVQGQILVRAAGELGLDPSRAVMPLAYGDEWSNILQPFWALPLLAITGLRARDILGYTLAMMLCAGPIYLLAFALA